ncbi:hypothetical protein CRE_26071 [Caenorhabditis remanei]|uniref:Strictosidine synthase conserved region domain-containing protein n=1 Tax=Caenorhabditis remanei TaxID=31234 RepID=E3LRJ8_CAERE|nr:hypothetical protein CRE_26071 [Caenorhabditis remanei]
MGRIFFFGFIGLAISWVALYYRYSDEKNTLARKYRLDPPPGLIGNLFINADLEKATHILDGKISGPESMVVDDDAIYASVYDAKILKIVNGKVVSKAAYSEKSKFFPDCGHFDTEPECGRPLGIRRLVTGKPKFVVADAYLGVFIVDFTNEQDREFVETESFLVRIFIPATSTQILDSRVPIDGFKPRFLNDLDVISEDEIVITDSSIRHDRRHFMPLILEHHADGRILHLKISSKTVKVLADKLYFPNGIQLTEDKQSVLFSECSMARIKKLTIASGKIEMFSSNLPGLPDNIRSSGRGTYWVGLAATRSATHPSLLDRLGSHPAIRQFLVDIIPTQYWKPLLSLFKSPHSIILELDSTGQIIRSLHDVTGKVVGDVSQVTEHNGELYIGSFADDFIAKLKL